MDSSLDSAAGTDAAATVDELIVVVLPDTRERYLSTDRYEFED
ncbi:hypothetical protein HTG_17280 [Natrinema mahii]|nr:hypothetical protein HTG_17280 [Natrinema mahii]